MNARCTGCTLFESIHLGIIKKSTDRHKFFCAIDVQLDSTLTESYFLSTLKRILFKRNFNLKFNYPDNWYWNIIKTWIKEYQIFLRKNSILNGWKIHERSEIRKIWDTLYETRALEHFALKKVRESLLLMERRILRFQLYGQTTKQLPPLASILPVVSTMPFFCCRTHVTPKTNSTKFRW